MPSNQVARRTLAALLEHPLGKRLTFVDPLTFAELPAGAEGKGWARTASMERQPIAGRSL